MKEIYRIDEITDRAESYERKYNIALPPSHLILILNYYCSSTTFSFMYCSAYNHNEKDEHENEDKLVLPAPSTKNESLDEDVEIDDFSD